MTATSAKDPLVARARLLRALGTGGISGDLSCLKGLSEAEWGEIVELARRHSVTPLLHRRLKPAYADLEVPESVRAELRKHYLTSGVRNTRLFALLNPVLSALKAGGIDVVVLKGAHLAELVYEEVALRPMVDVDLLVRKGDLPEATRILRSLGYGQGSADDPNGEGLVDPVDVHLHLRQFSKPGGLHVEIHYSIAIPAQMRGVDVEGVWNRTESARIAGTAALVLSPEDLIVHLCIHAAFQHGFAVNLLHLCDLPVVVEHYGDRVDWMALRERARAWGGERSVLVTLALTERLLGWRPPEAAAKALGLVSPGFDVVALSEGLVFREPVAVPWTSALSRLWSDSSPVEKTFVLLNRVFPSKDEMGFLYGVPVNSPKFLLLYPKRLWQLLGRYSASVVRALRGNEAARSSLDVETQRNRLVDWLGSA